LVALYGRTGGVRHMSRQAMRRFPDMISARHPIAALRTRSGETRRMTHRTTIDDRPRATVSRIWSAAARWCHPRPTRGRRRVSPQACASRSFSRSKHPAVTVCRP